MLEYIPTALGEALRGVRAGYDMIVSEDPAFSGAPDAIRLTSPAFQNRSTLPVRFTADGEGVSPPLAWEGSVADADALVLIVEDPDAPSPKPLLHLLAWDLPPDCDALAEGLFTKLGRDGLDEAPARDSLKATNWLAPDPPTGHGRHQYVFQIFALDRRLAFDRRPGRRLLAEAMKGHVLAKGVLTGLYERRG